LVTATNKECCGDEIGWLSPKQIEGHWHIIARDTAGVGSGVVKRIGLGCFVRCAGGHKDTLRFYDLREPGTKVTARCQ